MAKNDAPGNPKGSCEKIYKATLSTMHRISHRPRSNVQSPVEHPAAKANVSSTKPIAFCQPPASTEIPIEFEPRQELLLKQRIEKEKEENANVRVQKVTVEPHQGDVPAKAIPPKDGEGGRKLVEQRSLNDRVGNFIARVKDKMRATSNVGRGRSFSRRDSFNDRVSNYINHVKIKLKTTSTIKSNED